VHLGVRPASDGIGDYALTVQISTEWGPCSTDVERDVDAGRGDAEKP
jgi:hypothetical protein